MDLVQKIKKIEISRLLLLSEIDRNAISAFMPQSERVDFQRSLDFDVCLYFNRKYCLDLQLTRRDTLESILDALFTQMQCMSFLGYAKMEHEKFMQLHLRHNIKSVKLQGNEIYIGNFAATKRLTYNKKAFSIECSTLRFNVLFCLIKDFNKLQIDAEILENETKVFSTYQYDNESTYALKTERVTHICVQHRSKLILTFNSESSAREFYSTYLTQKNGKVKN